jgi:hypothetical protein
MNSKEFIQAIENKDVLVYWRQDGIITKKICSQKTGKGYRLNDFEIGLFIVFDDVKKYGNGENGEIGLYLMDRLCGLVEPDKWVIA